MLYSSINSTENDVVSKKLTREEIASFALSDSNKKLSIYTHEGVKFYHLVNIPEKEKSYINFNNKPIFDMGWSKDEKVIKWLFIYAFKN